MGQSSSSLSSPTAQTIAPTDISSDGPQSDSDRTGGQAEILHVIRRLWLLLEKQHYRLYLAILCGTLASVFSLAPYLSAAGALVELSQEVTDWNWIMQLAFFAFCGVILEKSLLGLATHISHTAAFATQKDLRFRLAEKLARLPLGFVEERSKGDLRTSLVDDVEILEDGMGHLVPELTSALIAPLLTIFILMFVDWRLALLLLLPVVLGMWLLNRMMKQGDQSAKNYIAAQTKMAEVTAEVADGMATVRAFNQQGQSTLRSRDIFAKVRKVTAVWLQQSVSAGASAQIMLSSNLLFVGPIGLYMAAYDLVTPSVLAAFLAIAYGFGDIFAVVNGLAHRMMQQVQLLARIDEVLLADTLPEAKKPKVPQGGSIEFDNVSFSYDQKFEANARDGSHNPRLAIQNVSFRADTGQSIALVGPSGCGKSTLIKLAARFYDISPGSIKIGGCDIRHLSADTLNQQISSVFQDVFLFSGTIADNIRLGKADASIEEIHGAAKRAQAHDFIMALPQGYETRLGERGSGLSGGERQRISIARAILKDAPILLLDEATAFADPENEALVQKAIADLAQDRTIIVIAHRLHTIAHVDQIIVLEDGAIVERGTEAELLEQSGLYARMRKAADEVRDMRAGHGQATPDQLEETNP